MTEDWDWTLTDRVQEAGRLGTRLFESVAQAMLSSGRNDYLVLPWRVRMRDEPDEPVELRITVPARLRRELDAMAEELGIADGPVLAREILHDATEPILTPGAQKRIAEGYADVAAGRTLSLSEAEARLGIEPDET